MREIKFRIWYTEYKTMSEEIDIYEHCGCSYDPENEMYLQYTGYKDKNGKEIYEGDIVKDSTPYVEDFSTNEISLPENKIVYWAEGHCGFALKHIKHEYTDFDISQHRLEVVGNIHENPELLNERN